MPFFDGAPLKIPFNVNRRALRRDKKLTLISIEVVIDSREWPEAKRATHDSLQIGNFTLYW